MRCAKLIALKASALLALIVVGQSQAHSATITYNFAGKINNDVSGGPLAGLLFSGSFSYSDSIVPIGGGLVAGGFFGPSGLLTAVDLTFNGISYDFTTVNAGHM